MIYKGNDLIYEESYNGTLTTKTTLYVESTLLKLILTNSNGNGWSSGSILKISSESEELGEFSLSSGSSIQILFHPVVGIIDETPIKDCSELENLPLTATSLIMGANICNSESIVELNLADYKNLVIIEIGDDNLMYVNTFAVDGLNHLNYLKIGMNSFTKYKGSYYSDKSRFLSVLNCIELESIEIGLYSFSDYAGSFELKNLPKLVTINIGEIGTWSCNFYWSSFEIKGIIDVILLMNRSSSFEFHYIR